MAVKVNPAHWATQMARWDSADGLACAYVSRTSQRDGRGATGWAYYIGCPTEVPRVGVGYTFARPDELIYAPTGDSAEVLATLAGFVGAWAEALDSADRGRESDNADLFPIAVRCIADYADEFYCEVSPFGDD